ncbi:MAG: type VII toxin-antitoxin system MntA family adenylyltransferase antitoxin [Solirubrobacteraceae bacterium]
MVKRDEHAAVPKLGRDARARLAAALDVDGVVAAMLFGSQARGQAGPLSDVDLAVWLDPALSRSERHARRLDLIAAATRALGSGELDLVVLNDATPLLRHRVRRDGQRLLDRDPRTRVRLEARALVEYLDTAPLRATLAAGVRHRIEEGRFGRP